MDPEFGRHLDQRLDQRLKRLEDNGGGAKHP